MAETTRPRPLAKVRPTDSASVVTDSHVTQILDDLAAGVINLEAHDDTKPSKRTAALSRTPNSAGGTGAAARCVTASARINHHNNENKGITYG
jgi:crotonobetainyl-CoA:carnitine CoA-transferase CaiB-like acyl-CoA transferase